MSDLPLDQVRTLLAVVDEQSFDAAAAVLHVTPSAVSQRVKALEQRTGRVLLLRTKPVSLTTSGQVLVRFARSLAQLEQDALSELGLGSASVRTLSVAPTPWQPGSYQPWHESPSPSPSASTCNEKTKTTHQSSCARAW
jgi:LysR family transcriptional regulator, chromosome initiation inhibitor